MPLVSLSRVATSVLRWTMACVMLAAVLFAPAAHAVEPFVIKDIRIEGIQRTDPGTVFGALPFRIGDSYTDEKGATALRALFATGLFKDVRIEIEQQIVIVVIDERAIIATVSFVGLKEFEQDVLLKSLREAGIGDGLPFDRALIDRAEQEIKRQYLSRSLYGAEVVTTVTPIERNRVNVTFTMTEGDAARIREIRIVGASAFTESTLLGQFEASPSGWLSWYTKGDRYSRAKLNADLEKLRAWYLNRGFLEFAIESTQVTISPDKQDISVTITIREGQVFTVTGVRLEGNFLGREDEFRALVSVVPGRPYRGDDVASTVRRFGDLFANYGFAFARVEPRPEIDRNNGQVVVVFVADPLRRVYVRRIEVSGNTRTRDEVIRREFRQFEASWYDGAKIKLSKERVDRLGFFKEVSVDTVEVAGVPDQVDLVVTVDEKPTGNLSLGAGYSSAENLTLTASIQQENVFGSGHFLGLSINTGSSNRTFASTRSTRTGRWTACRAASTCTTATPARSTPSATATSLPPGAARCASACRSPSGTRSSSAWATSRPRLATAPSCRTVISCTVRSTGRRATGAADGGLVARHAQQCALPHRRPLLPGRCRAQRAGRSAVRPAESAGAAVLEPARQLDARPEWRDRLGLWPGLQVLPGVQELLQRRTRLGAGVPAELARCHRPDRGVHRRHAQAQRQLRAVHSRAGHGQRQGLRFFTFFDIGNAWGEDQPLTWDSLRASVGLGISWVSPMGPLKLSYGTPVMYQQTDRIQPFQFQIGTRF